MEQELESELIKVIAECRQENLYPNAKEDLDLIANIADPQISLSLLYSNCPNAGRKV